MFQREPPTLNSSSPGSDSYRCVHVNMGHNIKKQDGLRQSDNELPNFNTDILQSLKSNIEENLKRTNKPSSKAENQKSKKAKKKPEQPEVTSTKKFKAAGDLAPAQKPQSNGVSKARSKPAAAPTKTSGKKRLRNGEVKGATPGQKGKRDVNSTKLGPRKGNEIASPAFDLREEIEALGGDDEDYRLVANAQSESEMEGDDGKGLDGKLNEDLNSFVQQLGIGSVQPEGDLDSEDNSEEEGHEMESKDPILNGKSSSKIAEKVQLPASTTISSGKNLPTLVCY